MTGMDNKPLYDQIWETVGKKVGYGIDADFLTDQIMDVVNNWLPVEHETNSWAWNKCVRSIRSRIAKTPTGYEDLMGR